MIELISMGFFQRALVGGVAVSALCGSLSVFVTLRRMSFIGVGVSHSAFGGVALGFLLGVDPLWTGVGFAVLVAVLIEWSQSRGEMEEDTAIGIFFATSMALGVVFVNLSRHYNVDLFGFLFGNILGIGRKELWEIILVSVCVLVFIGLLYKELIFLAFDQEMAWLSGVPVSLLRYVFLVVLAFAVIVAIHLTGVILVSALLVIPGAAARNLSKDVHRMIGISVGVAMLSTLGGLILSAVVDFPSGATVVLLLSVFFFLSLMANKLTCIVWPFVKS